MKKTFYLMFALSQIFIAFSYSKPMETFENYNVILVHGAGGSETGLDCNNANSIYEANYYRTKDEDDYLGIIGGYGAGISIDFDLSGRGLGATVLSKKRKSSAKDMDLEDDDGKNIGLLRWLRNEVFDKNDTTLIYLQRPFTDPANSPVNNARELGDRKWKGNKNCAVRRSLIEEAQEVRANGRDKLKSLRENKLYNELPPSRNILIAHSMAL